MESESLTKEIIPLGQEWGREDEKELGLMDGRKKREDGNRAIGVSGA